MASMYCMVRNRISFSNRLSYHLVRSLRELYFLCLLYPLSANLFALAARRRKRTMPSLPQANTVPVKNKIYQKARSCRRARENLFLCLQPRADRKSNLTRSSFLMRCRICSCIWKASRKNGMIGWNLHREHLQDNSQGCKSLFRPRHQRFSVTG